MGSTPANAIEIDSMEFSYRSNGGEHGVRVGTLVIGAGEQVLLIGHSGSGKSTLLHLIAGLMDPSEGTVLVGGTDIHALHGHKRDTFRGRHIGMVFQTFNLLRGFSAIENVMAGLMFGDRPKREHRSVAADLLNELGLKDHGADIGTLSVGQQQRVAVARALACGPTVVLADEPTASLDPENAAAAVSLMQRVCAHHGAALVCVSHDPALVEKFERCERLDALAAADQRSTGGAC